MLVLNPKSENEDCMRVDAIVGCVINRGLITTSTPDYCVRVYRIGHYLHINENPSATFPSPLPLWGEPTKQSTLVALCKHVLSQLSFQSI